MARRIEVEIVGDARSLERAFKKSSKSAKNFQGDMDKTGRTGKRAFGGLGRMAGFAAGAIGTAGLISVAKTAFSEFSEAEKAAAQTAAALKSTGGAANVTAKEIDALAESTLRKTGIDDEAVKVAENMLLTFTKIRNRTGKNNKIFNRATGAVADLATAMNQGSIPSAEQMQQASLQLGKALNDPVKGIGALRRVGIAFTKEQQKQIKTLVATGDTMGAQKIILAELNKEVGGRGAAAGKTFAGQWRILNETLNNLLGTLAAKLMPTIRRYLEQAVRWLNNTKNQKKIIDTVTGVARTLGDVIGTLHGAFKKLADIVGGNYNAIKLLVGMYASWKIVSIAGNVATLAGNMANLKTQTKLARGQVRLLRGALAGGLVVSLILEHEAIDKQLKKWGVPFAGKSGLDVLRSGLKHITPRAPRLQATGGGGAAHVTVGVDRSANLVPRVEQQLTKRNRGRPRRRRGAR